MSDNSLPDEIISEILSPALKVTDEVFSDTSNVSPFAKYSESTSAYLLVCKSWLRVATPLLYSVVILRSKAQAKALSIALSKDRQLGQFIKKLRVEGGYGPPMRIILECSPNISDLWLSLEIYSSDNSSGLCKGLSLINPTRLILRDRLYKLMANKMIAQLVDALALSMAKWDRLCIFDCPYVAATSRSNAIIRPLLQSGRLHTLSIPFADCLDWAYQTLKSCPLQSIHIKTPVAYYDRGYIPDKNPAVMALLKFRDAPTTSLFGKAKVPEPIELPNITPSLDPSFTPLAGASKEVYDAVLSRILYFAMFVPEDNLGLRGIPSRLPLLLVSKAFNRVGMRYYYVHTLLRFPSSIRKLASVISKNPSVGPHVRTIDGGVLDSQLGYLDDEADNDASETSMVAVLSQTNGLVQIGRRNNFPEDPISILGENGISWAAFAAMAESSGSSLRGLHVRIGKSEQASTTLFSHLTALRNLDLKCETDFIDSANTPADGFPSLEKLRISSTSQSFLTALSLMKLESLRHIVISYRTPDHVETVLEAHGVKLTDLHIPFRTLQTLKVQVFKLCPNLSSITLSSPGWLFEAPVRADDLHLAESIPSLVKIILQGSFYAKRKDAAATWGRFFTNFKPTSFPNLREMEVNCCVWPTSERDISKSCWVRWAEILLKHNVSLTDKTGKKWRPRLQVK
ncbi:hypothetical protein DFH06DRAFT_1462712 [Mycena polygramma]|nr:hypothetical protein DFH06DRAFT_1462712 [Mycena polygramma]